jgi:translation initiation factor IF-3
VIDETGKNLGILPIEQALVMAKERNLDLIEIVSNLQPPIAKIYDFGKFLYQKEKEEKKQRAKQRTDEMKSIRLTFGIGKHDLEFKAKQAEQFLEDYTKIQIEMVLRGREKSRQDFARQKMGEFLKMITKPFKVVQEAKRFPRGLIVIIGK